MSVSYSVELASHSRNQVEVDCIESLMIAYESEIDILKK